MASKLGDLSLDQVTEIAPHPMFPAIRVVSTRQKYVSHTPITIFGASQSVSRPNLEEALRIPGVAATFHNLVVVTNELYDSDGLVPDSGGDNLVRTTDDALKLIDGQPVTAVYPKVQENIMRQIDHLARALDHAA